MLLNMEDDVKTKDFSLKSQFSVKIVVFKVEMCQNSATVSQLTVIGH